MPQAPALIRRSGLIAGRVLKRYQRFLVDVELEDGRVVTAHSTNTGTMRTCWEAGDLVLLEPADRPERKLKFTWIACCRDGAWIGVETGLPNKVVAEAARRDLLPGLPALREVRTEVKYGEEGSRIDVWARDVEGREVYVEVKNTTLKVGTHACFPDAITSRGLKHLRELQAMVQRGHRAVIAFFVHRGDVDRFDAARGVDPAYAEELDRAALSGVEVLPLRVQLEAFLEPAGMPSEGEAQRELASGPSPTSLWTPWTLEWRLSGLLSWDPLRDVT